MNSFEDAMINVRSAFRLLYCFNERILSLMQYVEKKFDIPFMWDNSHVSEPPLKKADNLHKRYGGWTWLPLYYHEFHFEKKGVQFSIFLQCDTGAWEAEKWEDIDSYSDAEKSKTRLLFAITNSKKLNISEIDDKLLGDKELFDYASANKRVFIKAFDLAEFKDEKETRKSLENFLSFIKEKGITDMNFIDD